METVEIVLIVTGIVFFIASCFVQEKFSQKDIDTLAKMSESELKMTIERQVGSAKMRAGEAIGEIIDESLGVAQRGLEKETNKKIMAVSEYSDTILESMNKTHNEIMFLYSMLNDKHVELTQFANSLKQITSQKVNPMVNTPMFFEENTKRSEMETYANEKLGSDAQILREEREALYYGANEEDENIENYSKSEKILALHKRGKSDVEIAKDLECGLGEVRLVLGLYKEEQG